MVKSSESSLNITLGAMLLYKVEKHVCSAVQTLHTTMYNVYYCVQCTTTDTHIQFNHAIAHSVCTHLIQKRSQLIKPNFSFDSSVDLSFQITDGADCTKISLGSSPLNKGKMP